MRRSYLIPLLLAALLCGCTQEAAANSTVSHSDTATSSANTDIFSARDLEIGYDADTADQTENTLAATGTFEALDGNNIDAAVFSTADLTLNGAGSLTVTSTDHGVVTKDDLTITSGTYTVTAASHGLVGKDAVAIAGGTFRLETDKDGVQSDHENTDKGWIYLAGGDFTVVSDGDGFSASSTLTVVGGSYTLTTGGGRENGKTHADDAFPGGGRGGMIGPGGQPPEDFDPDSLPEDFDPEALPEDFDRDNRPEDFGGGQTPPQSEESAQTEEAAAEESVSTKGFKTGAASARNRPKRARRRKGAPLEAPPSAPKNPQPNGCGFLGERKEREKFGVWCCLRIYHTPEAVGSCERTEKSL